MSGFIFQNKTRICQRGTEEASPARKLDQTMRLDTRLHGRCLCNASTSARLLRTAVRALWEPRQNDSSKILLKTRQWPCAWKRPRTHTHTQSVPEAPHWAVSSQSCIQALLWRWIIPISQCGVVWSWWQSADSHWLKPWPKIHRITDGWDWKGPLEGILYQIWIDLLTEQCTQTLFLLVLCPQAREQKDQLMCGYISHPAPSYLATGLFV